MPYIFARPDFEKDALGMTGYLRKFLFGCMVWADYLSWSFSKNVCH